MSTRSVKLARDAFLNRVFEALRDKGLSPALTRKRTDVRRLAGKNTVVWLRDGHAEWMNVWPYQLGQPEVLRLFINHYGPQKLPKELRRQASNWHEGDPRGAHVHSAADHLELTCSAGEEVGEAWFADWVVWRLCGREGDEPRRPTWEDPEHADREGVCYTWTKLGASKYRAHSGTTHPLRCY